MSFIPLEIFWLIQIEAHIGSGSPSNEYHWKY
jgi:hypothetical protein